MADAVDAVDDFLADVTAFVVADGLGFDAAFERDVGVVHVEAEARDAGFDAGDLEGVPTAGASAEGFCGGDEFIGDGAEGVERDEEVEAAAAEARLVHQIDVAERGIGNFDGGEFGGRNFGKECE